MTRKITSKEFLQWKELDVTKQVFEVIGQALEQIKENWSLGAYDSEKEVFFALGQCDQLRSMLSMHAQIVEEESEEDNDGN